MQDILALLNNVLSPLLPICVCIAYRMLPDFLIVVFQIITKQLDEKTFCGKAHGTN